MLSDALLVECPECGFVSEDNEYNYCPECEGKGILDVELEEF